MSSVSNVAWGIYWDNQCSSARLTDAVLANNPCASDGSGVMVVCSGTSSSSSWVVMLYNTNDCSAQLVSSTAGSGSQCVLDSGGTYMGVRVGEGEWVGSGGAHLV